MPAREGARRERGVWQEGRFVILDLINTFCALSSVARPLRSSEIIASLLL